jgi:hypothetical protein
MCAIISGCDTEVPQLVSCCDVDVNVSRSGLARNQVDRAHRGRAKIGAIGVVAHRVVLGIVPQRRNRIAVKIAHHLTGCEHGCRRSTGRRTCAASVRGEQIHHAAVEGELFGHVVMIHILCVRLRAIKTERIGCAGSIERVKVGVIVQQSDSQTVHSACAGKRVENGVLPSGSARSDACRNSGRRTGFPRK